MRIVINGIMCTDLLYLFNIFGLLINDVNYFANIFSNDSKTLKTILFPKDPFYYPRKQLYWCHCNMRQVMVNRGITGCQYSIYHDIASLGQRHIGTWKKKHLQWSPNIQKLQWFNLGHLNNNRMVNTDQFIIVFDLKKVNLINDVTLH